MDAAPAAVAHAPLLTWPVRDAASADAHAHVAADADADDQPPSVEAAESYARSCVVRPQSVARSVGAPVSAPASVGVVGASDDDEFDAGPNPAPAPAPATPAAGGDAASTGAGGGGGGGGWYSVWSTDFDDPSLRVGAHVRALFRQLKIASATFLFFTAVGVQLTVQNLTGDGYRYPTLSPDLIDPTTGWPYPNVTVPWVERDRTSWFLRASAANQPYHNPFVGAGAAASSSYPLLDDAYGYPLVVLSLAFVLYVIAFQRDCRCCDGCAACCACCCCCCGRGWCPAPVPEPLKTSHYSVEFRSLPTPASMAAAAATADDDGRCVVEPVRGPARGAAAMDVDDFRAYVERHWGAVVSVCVVRRDGTAYGHTVGRGYYGAADGSVPLPLSLPLPLPLPVPPPPPAPLPASPLPPSGAAAVAAAPDVAGNPFAVDTSRPVAVTILNGSVNAPSAAAVVPRSVSSSVTSSSGAAGAGDAVLLHRLGGANNPEVASAPINADASASVVVVASSLDARGDAKLDAPLLPSAAASAVDTTAAEAAAAAPSASAPSSAAAAAAAVAAAAAFEREPVSAFVTFRHIRDRDKCYDDFNGLTSHLRCLRALTHTAEQQARWCGCRCRCGPRPYRGAHLRVRPAKEPDDVSWHNLGLSACGKFARRAVTLCGALVLWGCYFSILMGVERQRDADDSDSDSDGRNGVLEQFTLGCLGAGLVVFARAANAVIVFLASFERHRSHSATEESILRYRLVMEFVHYMGVFVFVFWVSDAPALYGVARVWFRRAAPVLCALFVSEAAVSVLLALLLPEYECRKFVGRHTARTQRELNAAYRPPRLNVWHAYNALYVSGVLATVYAAGLPVLLVVSGVKLALMYWIEKYNVLRRYRTSAFRDARSARLLRVAVLYGGVLTVAYAIDLDHWDGVFALGRHGVAIPHVTYAIYALNGAACLLLYEYGGWLRRAVSYACCCCLCSDADTYYLRCQCCCPRAVPALPFDVACRRGALLLLSTYVDAAVAHQNEPPPRTLVQRARRGWRDAAVLTDKVCCRPCRDRCATRKQ